MGQHDEDYEATEHSEEQYEADQHNAWMEIKCTEECVKEDMAQMYKEAGVKDPIQANMENRIKVLTGENTTPSTSTPAVMPGSPEWKKELEKQVWGHTREEVYKKSIEEGGIMKHMQVWSDRVEGESGSPIADKEWAKHSVGREELAQIKITEAPTLIIYNSLEEILQDMIDQKRHLTIMSKLYDTINKGYYIQTDPMK